MDLDLLVVTDKESVDREFAREIEEVAEDHRTRRAHYEALAATLADGPVRNDPSSSVMPEMLPRPAGMSRQVHRRLFREACAIAGVDYRAVRKK